MFLEVNLSLYPETFPMLARTYPSGEIFLLITQANPYHHFDQT